MPTQTFTNLSEEKRSRFIAIALEEFANHDYASASVSQIVARAGIAKGSVYQYFRDKQELFFYLLEIANQTLLAAIQVTPFGENPSFFERLRRLMSASVQVAVKYPLHARLIMRAHTAPLPFRSEVIQQARKARIEFLNGMVQEGIRNGEIEPDLDPDIAAQVIGSLVNEIGQTVMERLDFEPAQIPNGNMDQFDHPVIEKIFDQYMKIIRSGLTGQSDGSSLEKGKDEEDDLQP